MYTYKEIPEDEQETKIFEEDMDTLLPQYEILDEDGDQLAVVHSEVEAETLISHLNK